MMDEVYVVLSSLNHTISSLTPDFCSRSNYRKLVEISRSVPRTPIKRLQESLNDEVVDLARLRDNDANKEKTYLYLGYGSNMCALSFLKRRKIKPLSQVNVVVPAIQLSFDLPGIPYREPCFGNVRIRNTSTNHEKLDPIPPTLPTYHKDRWPKGLVGIVYEVTASDFAHILATEGGGSSYQDVLVDCFSLASDPSTPVPLTPTTTPFKAHTLFCPAGVGISRPDPSYAQPSARYLKLLTDGAAEHDLPTEYREYLAQIRPYTATTAGQKAAAVLFVAVWIPILLALLFGVGKVVIRPDGTYPAWFAKLILTVHRAEWVSYDRVFRPTYGDGERSVGGGSGREDVRKVGEDQDGRWDEKMPLLARKREAKEWCEPGTRRGEEMV